jgi:DNA adenine methylase
MSDLLADLLDIGSEDTTHAFDRTTCVRAPFSFQGSKWRSLDKIIPRLGVHKSNTWVDHFGGTGVVSWNIPKCNVMVYNDRYSALVAFYRCLRDEKKKEALLAYLESMPPHSREDFYWARDTWVNDVDDVIRSAKWYYGLCCSVLGRQKAFARAISSHAITNVWQRLPMFEPIHRCLQSFTLENLDVFQCITDYDTPQTIHYFDPPYVGTDQGGYQSKWGLDDQARLLKAIGNCRGFVALSHYPCNVIDEQPYWTNRYQWEHLNSVGEIGESLDCGTAVECLWIKQ